MRLFSQDYAFFLSAPVNDRFLVTDAQRDLAISSSVLLALPASSLCLDANEEIDLQATRSLGCWSLHLYQANQMWVGESSELLVAKGYWIAVGAKPSPVVDERFCLIPTDDANCCYLNCLTFRASAAQCKPTKKGVQRWCVGCLSNNKVRKRMEKRKKGASAVGVAYLSLVESLPFLLEIFLDYKKDNLIILVMRYFFPYQ